MKQWFNKLLGCQKTTLHFVFFFIIYLALYLGYHLLWPRSTAADWEEYIAQAFVFSFILEAVLHWLMIVPDYFEKSKAHEPTS